MQHWNSNLASWSNNDDGCCDAHIHECKGVHAWANINTASTQHPSTIYLIARQIILWGHLLLQLHECDLHSLQSFTLTFKSSLSANHPPLLREQMRETMITDKMKEERNDKANAKSHNCTESVSVSISLLFRSACSEIVPRCKLQQTKVDSCLCSSYTKQNAETSCNDFQLDCLLATYVTTPFFAGWEGGKEKPH